MLPLGANSSLQQCPPTTPPPLLHPPPSFISWSVQPCFLRKVFLICYLFILVTFNSCLFCFLFYLLWLSVVSGPRVKLAGCLSALNPPLVYSTDRSKAVVQVLVLLFVALWFILWGDLFCSICACLDLLISSSSSCLGRAAVCDCGSPWTYLLPFFFLYT